jgi:glutamate dehydrogenase/leucine dehydrogenase
MQEMIPFVGPRTEVMAPDMGTNQQMMPWFTDNFLHVSGQAGRQRRHGGKAGGDLDQHGITATWPAPA